MEASFLKKLDEIEREAELRLLKHGQIYQANKEENKTYDYPISALCKLGNISNKAAYYKWLHREITTNEIENMHIADEIEKIHANFPDKG